MPLYPTHPDPTAQGLYNKMPRPVQSVVDFFTPNKAELPFSPAPLGMLAEGGAGLISRLLATLDKQQGALRSAAAPAGVSSKVIGPSSSGYLNSAGPVQGGAKTLEKVLLERGVDLRK